MAQVTVTIDGKSYRMACDEGQEEHLTGLASRFDRYVSHLKGSFGEIGDIRLTVMAGIMVMDEMSEVQKRLASLEQELRTFRQGQDAAFAQAGEKDAAVAAALMQLAERMESLAGKLALKA